MQHLQFSIIVHEDDVFPAREDEIKRIEQEQRLAKSSQQQRTFEWVHTHVGPQNGATTPATQNARYVQII